MPFYDEYFKSIYDNLISVDDKILDEAVDLLKETSNAGGKVIFGGNGGSSAMASHVAVDLTKNDWSTKSLFETDVRPLLNASRPSAFSF